MVTFKNKKKKNKIQKQTILENSVCGLCLGGGALFARDSRQSSGASSLLSRQSLSPSHFQRSWMQRLFLQANSPGWHLGGGT